MQFRIVIGNQLFAAVETLTSDLGVVTIIAAPSVVECSHCHTTFDSLTAVSADGTRLIEETHEGEYVCRTCIESSGKFRVCHHCETIGRAENMVITDDLVACPDCAWKCDNCKEMKTEKRRAYNGYGMPICAECAG